MVVLLTEQIPAADVFDLEPAGWESDDRDLEFPAIVATHCGKRLDVDPRIGARADAMEVQNAVGECIDDVVRTVTDTGVSSSQTGTGATRYATSEGDRGLSGVSTAAMAHRDTGWRTPSRCLDSHLVPFRSRDW